jgi:hypothetical protein
MAQTVGSKSKIPARTNESKTVAKPASVKRSPSQKAGEMASAAKGWGAKLIKQGQEVSGKAVKQLMQAASDTGLLRTNMDNISGPEGMKVGKSFDTPEQSKAFFDQRLKKAEAFLKARGMEGQVVAKMVSADMITVGGHAAVEHAEWQFFMVPKSDAAKAKPESNGLLFIGDKNQPKLPGLLDEKKMTSWVKEQTGAPADKLLRSKDNPLFLGRLNLGEGGAGLYTNTPEYAEVGGQKFKTRHLESMVLVSPERVRKAVDDIYAKLPGEWGQHGTCQQGVMATAESFGLDKNKFAKEINGLWLTRLKFGRTGNFQPGQQ